MPADSWLPGHRPAQEARFAREVTLLDRVRGACTTPVLDHESTPHSPGWPPCMCPVQPCTATSPPMALSTAVPC
jgi:hypothetical protein